MKTLLILIGGGILVYELYANGVFGTVPASTSSSTTTTPTTTTTTTPTATPSSSAASSAVSLASLYSQIVSMATASAQSGNTANGLSVSGGTVSTTFSGWNYYLAQLVPWSLPAYSDLMGGAPDPNTPMTSSAYWMLMAPWLSTNHGLSGLGSKSPRAMDWRRGMRGVRGIGSYYIGNPTQATPVPFRWSPGMITGWY